jgi:hypothetical protein
MYSSLLDRSASDRRRVDQQGSVHAPQGRTTGLPGRNLQLVTKNEDLDLVLSALLARWHEAKEAP